MNGLMELLEESRRVITMDDQKVRNYFKTLKLATMNDKLTYKSFIKQMSRTIKRDDRKVKRYFEERKCCVCYDLQSTECLQCCHKLCIICYRKLSACPLCRTPYEKDDTDDDDAESYFNGISSESWWDYFNSESYYILREVDKRIGEYYPDPENECEDPCRQLNIMFNRDVIFKDNNGWIQSDDEYLSDWNTYQRLPLDIEHKRILADRIQKIVPLMISHCRYYERLGDPIQLKRLAEIRGY